MRLVAVAEFGGELGLLRRGMSGESRGRFVEPVDPDGPLGACSDVRGEQPLQRAHRRTATGGEMNDSGDRGIGGDELHGIPCPAFRIGEWPDPFGEQRVGERGEFGVTGFGVNGCLDLAAPGAEYGVQRSRTAAKVACRHTEHGTAGAGHEANAERHSSIAQHVCEHRAGRTPHPRR